MTLRPLSFFLGLSLLAQPPVDPAERQVRAHMAFLADGLLEGRGTGHRGGALAVRYLEAQLQALGVQPLGPEGYRQRVPVAGVRLLPSSRLVFRGPGGTWVPQRGTQAVYHLAAAEPEHRFQGRVVFVGHGIRAGDGSRDDYKGMDLKGALVVMLVGDRPDTAARSLGCSPENYYGRWTYKFEEALRQGAAGCLLIHTEASASYPWEVVDAGWTGQRFMAGGTSRPQMLQGWLHLEAARHLFRLGGRDLDRCITEAQGAGAHPVLLDLHAEAELKAEIRRFEEVNIAGVVPGRDPVLAREAVIFSAHWDHLGPAPDGDCYHGAVDNASACGAALALASEAVAHPTRRSQIFLFPCGEETGLLGSEAWVRQPLWPLERTVGVVNLESLNVVGPTRDIGLRGAREAGLWDLSVAAAKAEGLVPAPDRPDTAGLFFRSDHWPFVRAGVPSFSPGFSLDGGWDFLGDRQAQQARAAAFNKEHYHRTSDRYDPAWDLRGLLQQLRFAGRLGRMLADQEGRPRVTVSFR